MPDISSLLTHKANSYGIVYDIGDFPTAELLEQFSKANLVQENIVVFKQWEDFEGFLALVQKNDDIEYLFSTSLMQENIENSFISFKSFSRKNFSKDIYDFLQSLPDINVLDSF